MRKTFVTLMVGLIYLNAFSQKTIDNPKFSTATTPYVKITEIELYDTVTVLNLEITRYPKMSGKVASDKTYIQDSKGGNKLFVKHACIAQSKYQNPPEPGKNFYTLYFPPLEKSTETIDFDEEAWKIFEIQIVPQKLLSVIPERLQGNWLRTDGSNEWAYGFLDNMVICNNEFWDKILITNEGKDYHVSLHKEHKSKELCVRLTKNNDIYIGSDAIKMELFSRNKSFKPNYVIKNDEDFKAPIFKKDTAIYKGYIKGYHPKMGKTGMVYVDDIITHNQNSDLITINPDGTFIVKCAMINPHEVLVRIFGATESIYLEPGKTTLHFIDPSEYTSQIRSITDVKKRERKSLFMGDCARLNSDLQSTDSIYYFDYTKVQLQILDMNAVQYKTYCLDIMKREQEALKKYTANHQICKKALLIRQLQIPYRAYQNILSFNMNSESAYRIKNKVPRDQRSIPLVREELKPDYYKFINPVELNNPISLVSGDVYQSLINRILYAGCVLPPPGYVYIALSDTLKSLSANLSADEQELLKKLSECKTYEGLKTIQTQDSVVSRQLFVKYRSLLNSISRFAYEQIINNNLLQYFGLSNGLVNEIRFAQHMCSIMNGTYKPLSDELKKSVKENIKTDFIADYLLLISKAKEDEIAKKVNDNKEKKGYRVNESPKTEGDKLFDAIVQKYKGKVVFVDFWATWCGPCKAGIERMKPLKEELKGKGIVFVYLTNETSPIDTWNMMIPDIKGEHYRVKNDEWNYFQSRFKINGIPHYVLVNKAGVVVQNSIYFASSNNELKNYINQYLK